VRHRGAETTENKRKTHHWLAKAAQEKPWRNNGEKTFSTHGPEDRWTHLWPDPRVRNLLNTLPGTNDVITAMTTPSRYDQGTRSTHQRINPRINASTHQHVTHHVPCAATTLPNSGKAGGLGARVKAGVNKRMSVLSSNPVDSGMNLRVKGVKGGGWSTAS